MAARSAYRIVQVSAATGLALLVVAFAVCMTTSQASLQIVAAGLAAIGTAVSAYVGATSLTVWNRALSQFNLFDLQPLIIRQLAAAREVLDKFESPERHDAGLERIIATRPSTKAG
ncbi:hypothetical protein [Dactylosporangium sp. NPDC051541]|uniref:hypothetical protein n=1 Tax=Dactylosporangium sp. NPDC051541 TaxID=3363977 RepID=UPI0037B7414A